MNFLNRRPRNMKHSHVIALALVFALTGCNRDPATVEKQAAADMATGDYQEAEEEFRWLSSRRPNDVKLQANLAFALTQQDKDAEAIPIYNKLIDEGEGTYDLFAFYAQSLEGVGRDDDAIIWNYRALLIVPQLVDVRGSLAKLLKRKGRPYEALSLLASFDSQLEERGNNAYFVGQRIAIASKLAPPSETSGETIQATKIDGAYYTIAIGKSGETEPFLIDTGASHTTMSSEVLKKLGIPIPTVTKWVTMETADGSQVTARQSTIPWLQIGPYILKDVIVVQCENCHSLLGQSALARFDLATKRTDGLEILSMKSRRDSRDLSPKLP
jgi:clan AA aspartic protease (TIGR02281 family)